MAAVPQRTRRHAAMLLSLIAVLYLVFATRWVPRLTNNLLTDVAPTGWATYVASRMVRGGQLYDTLVLPEPPGAFLAMAGLQRVTGATLLLQELWVVAIAQLLLALLAYALAATLSTRRVAVLTALATLLVLVRFERQLAQDYFLQLCVWGSLTAGARALMWPDRSARWWVLSAALACLGLGFEQGGALGVIVGWGLGFGLLAWLGSPPRGALRPLAVGAGIGLSLVVLVVLLSGAGPVEYLRAVCVDGFSVRGGFAGLAMALGAQLFIYNGVYPSSILLTCAMLAVGFAVVKRTDSFHLGAEHDRDDRLSLWSTGWMAAAIVASFGSVLWALSSGRSALPAGLVLAALALGEVPKFGLALGLGYFAGQFGLARGPELAVQRRRGHAINALLVVAVAASFGHNLDAVAPVPLPPRFWAANPLVPLSLLFLFASLGRARLGWAQAVVVFCVAIGVFGPHFDRALLAVTPVTAGRYNGLLVSYRGVEVLRAVQAVQDHATRDQTVLVLPEDPQLATLMARPRPALRGAVVFPGEYPARLAEQDIATLQADPPQVIVLHPRRERSWRRLFAAFPESDGVTRVMRAADGLVQKRYRRVGSFRSVYLWDQGFIDVWVLDPEKRP